MLCLNRVYYWGIIYKEHTLQPNEIGNYLQKLLVASKEVWVCLDRESNAEKHKCFN